MDYRPLTADELRAIQRRADGATGGPWTVYERVIDEFLTERGIATTWTDPALNWQAPVVSASQTGKGIGTWIAENDAKFIAEARSDIPRLLETLQAFAYPVIYEALMHYRKRGLFQGDEADIIEEAMNTCWKLIKSKDATKSKY